MKLIAHTFVSLDGVMQGPGGAEEDPSGGFTRGGWLVPLADQDSNRIVARWFASTEALLLGHTTYDLFRGYWPQVAQDGDVISRAINTLPKYVAANGAVDPDPWASTTTVLGGDVVAQVRALKDLPGGELQIHGSHGLLQSLHGAGLIDQYRVLLFPVVVGGGKRLFEPGVVPSGFRAVSREATNTGVTLLNLVPADFSAGVFAVHDGRGMAVTH